MILLFLIWFQIQQYSYVAFGDSITVGMSAAAGQSYIELIEQQVGPIDNRAVSGSVIAQQVEHIRAYTGTAQNVIWLPGYNDMRSSISLEDYELKLREGLDILGRRGNRVYLGLCLRMTPEAYVMFSPNWSHGSDDRVEQINNLTRAAALNYPNVVIVDTAGYDPALYLSPDYIHPNDAGHQVIATAFLATIPRLIYLPLLFSSVFETQLVFSSPLRGGR